jgi:hypothetical protein
MHIIQQRNQVCSSGGGDDDDRALGKWWARRVVGWGPVA